MGHQVVGRGRECGLLRTVLEQGRRGPAVMLLDGQPGIGKTTLCRAAAQEATNAGFSVLTTTGAAAEVPLAWGSLADVIDALDESALDEVSPPHRRALSAVTTGMEAPGGDERLVAAAFRAALDRQSRTRPVLIVVDDAQWVDAASRLALGFAIRRLAGAVAVIAAFRTGEDGDSSWLQPADPAALTRLTLGPMAPADLRAVVAARRGQSPPARTMARIHAVSGGNPLYALELVRALEESSDQELETLPPTLAGLVRDRIGEHDAATAEAMLTAAAALEPTVVTVAAAIGVSPDELIGILQPMEGRGVLSFDGSRIRFTHPLIASGVISDASPVALRDAHRRLAAVVDTPEQRARHLALSSPHGDAETLTALDAAAETVAARGVYSMAAELVALAIGRGGDSQFRRMRGAEFLFRAGRLDDAEALLAPVVDELPAGLMRTVGLMLLAAIRSYRDGFADATGLLERAVQEAGDDPTLRTQALLLLSTASGVGGDMATSVEQARRARADAATTGLPDLHSQALAVWVSASMIYGLGLDTDALRTALEIGDPTITAPIMFRPTTVLAQTQAWTGRLEEARTTMREISRRCAELGNDLDVVWAGEQLTMIEVALGHYADAERTAGDALQRAELIGGRLPLINAYTAMANVAAHQGRLEDTVAAAELAVAAATAGNLTYMIGPPLRSLAFAQVSDGQYDAALETLEPLLARFDPAHDAEFMVGGYLPDAIAALAATGRMAQAEPLVEALETNGVRHDRPWMLATGARCRALVLAVSGDLDAAIEAAERAMDHHRRLPMPFERARTQLLLGQLQRRRRRAQAHENLSRAAATFDELGSPLWAARAHRELARLSTRLDGATLTDAEQQIAERAAARLTNKAIATDLYLSTKTVEMHLSNAYRKLGIRSRAQLAERLRSAAPQR